MIKKFKYQSFVTSVLHLPTKERQRTGLDQRSYLDKQNAKLQSTSLTTNNSTFEGLVGEERSG